MGLNQNNGKESLKDKDADSQASISPFLHPQISQEYTLEESLLTPLLIRFLESIKSGEILPGTDSTTLELNEIIETMTEFESILVDADRRIDSLERDNFELKNRLEHYTDSNLSEKGCSADTSYVTEDSTYVLKINLLVSKLELMFQN